jgi:hypothetical protein
MEQVGDGRPRCAWGASTPAMLAYHDTEWGVPLHDDSALFELRRPGCPGGRSWTGAGRIATRSMGLRLLGWRGCGTRRWRRC